MTKISVTLYKNYPQGRDIPCDFPVNILFFRLIMDNFMQTGSKMLFLSFLTAFFMS